MSEKFFKNYYNFFKVLDSYTSEYPNALTAEHKALILRVTGRLLSLQYPAPNFTHEKDTILLYWRKGNHYLSIDLDASNLHAWAATDAKNFYSGTWISAAEPLPDTALNVLNTIANSNAV